MAVGITVSMLLVTGMVFKSSTDAAGKAVANNSIMNQLRTVTGQLKSDFAGLNTQMPMAVIFELDPDDLDGIARNDTIVFFANGDFQTNDYLNGNNIASNMASVLYTQSDDDDLAIPGDPDNIQTPPYRRVLARSAKMFVQDGSIDWLNGSYPYNNSHAEYDYMPVHFTSSSNSTYWNSVTFNLFNDHYFKTDYSDTSSGFYSNGSRWSLVRRPNLSSIDLDGVQRLYMLGDITNFTIELWFPGAENWFPNDTDIDKIQTAPFVSPLDYPADPLAFYWNAPEDPINTPTDHTDTFIDGGINWRSEIGMQEIGNQTGIWSNSNVWPKAVRFTFRLHDRNRRHFAEGKIYSYIVELPDR